jgi:hypothetical protein
LSAATRSTALTYPDINFNNSAFIPLYTADACLREGGQPEFQVGHMYSNKKVFVNAKAA